jgi:hypothetical protein
VKQSLSILDAYLDDELTEEQRRQFEAWINEDPANMDCFVSECCLDSYLQDIFREEQVAHDAMAAYACNGGMEDVCRSFGDSAPADPQQVVLQNPSPLNTFQAPAASELRPPVAGFFFPTFDGAVERFFTGWPAAYLVATVVFAIALAIGAVVHVSHPVQVVRPSVPSPQPLASSPSLVGRITGMVDCQWEKGSGVGVQLSADSGQQLQSTSHQPLATNHSVSLGDRFVLRSGLMEITYDTGAKVILQGPVTYEVESPTSGYLSVGKLTARLEKRSAVSGQRSVASESETSSLSTNHYPLSTSSNPQSLIPNPSLSPVPCPLFSVRTPTATVTDLGTEFGVEVDKQGNTRSHVFRGSVNLHPLSTDAEAKAGDILLRENESASVETNVKGSPGVTARRIAPKPDGFTRSIKNKTSPPIDVLAWFRMGEDEPNARAGAPTGAEIHSHFRRYVHLDRHGSPTYSDDTAAPGSSLSMTFHGGSDGEYFSSPRFSLIPNDYFIFEAWVKMRKPKLGTQIIAASGQGAHSGYCLAVRDGRWHGVLEDVGYTDSGLACESGKWTHLALVCERGKAQLWVNGRQAGNVLDAIPNVPDGPFTIGGYIGDPERAFDGEIDEVRLSTFMAPFRPEMLLFRTADPPR